MKVKFFLQLTLWFKLKKQAHCVLPKAHETDSQRSLRFAVCQGLNV